MRRDGLRAVCGEFAVEVGHDFFGATRCGAVLIDGCLSVGWLGRRLATRLAR